MKIKYTLQEVTEALAIEARIEAGLKAANATIKSLAGDNVHPNGLVFDEVRFSAPYRAAN